MIQDAWGWCTGMTQRDGMGRELRAEEPGGPQSVGSQRVRHDLMTEQQQTIDNTGLCVLKNIFIFLI